MWIKAEDGNLYNTAHLGSIYVEKQVDQQWQILAGGVGLPQPFVVLAEFDDEVKVNSIFDAIQKRLEKVIEIVPLIQRFRNDRIDHS